MIEEADRTLPSIIPLRFYHETQDVDGEPVAVERVAWTKPGQGNSHVTSETIDRLRGNAERGRPAAMEWAVLEPYYTAWKSGLEMPEDGIPLEAWPGASGGLADVLARYQIRTVQQFASMPEQDVRRVSFPSILAKRDAARVFLKKHQDREEMEQELAVRDAAIAELRAQVEALKAPRRGRPPKAEKPEAEAEDEDAA